MKKKGSIILCIVGLVFDMFVFIFYYYYYYYFLPTTWDFVNLWEQTAHSVIKIVLLGFIYINFFYI